MTFRKSQGAIEFMLILLFVFFLMALIMFALGKYSVGVKEEERKAERDDFAASILHEVDLIQRVQGGYSRELLIAGEIMDRFNLTINSSAGYIRIVDYFTEGENTDNEYYYDLPGKGNFNSSIRMNGEGNYIISFYKGSLNLSDTIDLDPITADKSNPSPPADNTPDSFTFTNLTDVLANSTAVSENVTVNGFDEPITVSVSGDGSPMLSVNGGAWVVSSDIYEGDELSIRLDTAFNYSTNSLASVLIGDYSFFWNVRTEASPVFDTSPDPFAFTNVSDSSIGILVASENITPTGFDTGIPLSISGEGNPQLSINGSTWTTSGTLTPGDEFAIRLNSFPSYSANRTAIVVLGDYNYTWVVETMAFPANLSGIVLLMFFDNYSKLGENSSFFYDHSGNGNHGICNSASGSCPSLTSDGLSNTSSYDYDGNDFINYGNDASLNIAEGTVSLWAKASAASTSIRTLFSKDSSGYGDGDFLLSIEESDDPEGHPSEILFHSTSDDYPGINDRVYSTDQFYWGEWVHVAVTFGPDGKNIYINGVLNDTSARIYGMTMTSVDATTGAFNGGTGLFHNGQIDELAIWNRTLNETEILRLSGND